MTSLLTRPGLHIPIPSNKMSLIFRVYFLNMYRFAVEEKALLNTRIEPENVCQWCVTYFPFLSPPARYYIV